MSHSIPLFDFFIRFTVQSVEEQISEVKLGFMRYRMLVRHGDLLTALLPKVTRQHRYKIKLISTCIYTSSYKTFNGVYFARFMVYYLKFLRLLIQKSFKNLQYCQRTC